VIEQQEGYILMMQQQQTSHWKIITYRIAKWAWLITVWIWTSIIIAFLVQFIPNLLTTPDPAKTLPNTWAGIAVNWLRTPSSAPIEFLRVTALIVAFLLVAIPPLALFLKQMLQNVQREGFDKLIDVLQQDTISPQLDVLRQQLAQQVQRQDASIEALRQISGLLQQTPTASYLQGIHLLSQQHHALQREFSHTLQDIQTRTSEQVQRLSGLYEQDQRTRETISVGLEKISHLLERMQEQILSLPGYRESRSLSDPETITEKVPVVTPPIQTDHL
jgi:hypothetical protein